MGWNVTKLQRSQLQSRDDRGMKPVVELMNIYWACSFIRLELSVEKNAKFYSSGDGGCHLIHAHGVTARQSGHLQ
jgi:hypothetical protein